MIEKFFVNNLRRWKFELKNKIAYLFYVSYQAIFFASCS